MSDCFSSLEVFDLRYQGSTLTWTNNQHANPIAKKLDWLLNNNWIPVFSSSIATFLPPDFSDHTPYVLDLAFLLPQVGTRPFKFLNYLITHPLFLTTVETAWIQAGSDATTLASLSYKLKSIKSSLKPLNKDNFFTNSKESKSD